jgi:hypothetical protein
MVMPPTVRAVDGLVGDSVPTSDPILVIFSKEKRKYANRWWVL